MARPVLKTYGTLALVDGEWEVRAQPHVQIRLKHVFTGVVMGRIDAVRLSNTDEICRDLLWFCDRYPLEIDDESLRELRRGAKRQRARVKTIAKILEGDFQLPTAEMALPARAYQEQAAAAILNTGTLLLVDELGLGKTVAAIRVMADPRALPALCVVQASLTHQWVDEIHKFMPGLRVHILRTGAPYDLRDKEGNEPHVIVTSYNKLVGWAEHFVGKIKFVVFDEAQELRTGHSEPGSSSKNVASAQVSYQAEYRAGLTATPIYNYGGELWNIIDILAPGRLGAQHEFLREWCSGWNKRKAIVSHPKALGSYLRDAGLMLRRTRDDVGRELPPVSRILHEVQTDYAAPFWDVQSAAAELARIVLDKSAKGFDQMQAAGQLDIMLRQATGVAKAPQVAAFVRMLLEQETDKVVLFGWHREVYGIWDELLEDLGLAWYTGSESVSKKRKEVKRFIEGDAKVLVMSLRAGTGLNGLQDVCATAVFGELDWSHGVHEQCTGRLHRDGQGRPVFAYYVVSDSGSDPIVCDVLGLKTAQLEGIRDPDGAPIMARDVDPDHIKKLAQDYLRRFGGKT